MDVLIGSRSIRTPEHKFPDIKRSGVYTRGGDKGKTSLIGGRRVPKYHRRIEAYGTVDELMAHTAMLRDLVEKATPSGSSKQASPAGSSQQEEILADLLNILNIQMATASVLAADHDSSLSELPVVGEEQVAFLERRIDEMDGALQPLATFLLPGGHPAVSQAHIARTVCRRCEREVLKLAEEVGVPEDILRFYNRLSDYFFVLSRAIAALLKINQEAWKPGLYE